jgi:hypothetical protein
VKLACGILAASALLAADYRAGVARVEGASALAIEDPQGGRVVIASAGGSGVPRPLGELVAARAAKAYGLDRARLMLVSCGAPPEGDGLALADALVTAIGAALGDLKPAQIHFGTASGVPVLEVTGLATFSGRTLALGARGLAGEGRRVRGPVRAAFQVVELGRELSSGGPAVRSVSSAQVVRFGKELTMVALTPCGCTPRISRELAVLVAGPSGGSTCDADIEEALGRLMRRLGR